jgi:TM2 domain-containing membrane protein YozV
VLVPGLGHLLLRRYLAGSIWAGIVITMGLALAGGWRILPRLWAAAEALGLPPHAAVWLLGVLGVLVGVLHTASVVSSCVEAANSTAPPARPAVASFASLLIPGWGQLLNGHLMRGALLLVVTWTSVASWLLVSGPVEEMLIAYQLYLPSALALLASQPLRWALPAAVWPLAVYDAWISAQRPKGGMS